MPFAARLFDKTNHGGIIFGPGCPIVLIEGQAAARLGDAHACPAVDVLKPHVGGTIASGSATVMIGGSAAARVGDVTLCVGPWGNIVSGARTVMIG